MKSKSTIYWLYCILNHLYGKNAQIVRDPLGFRYAVNKYGLRLTVNGKTNKQVAKDLIDYLLTRSYSDHNEYQVVRKTDTTITYLSVSDYGSYVYLHVSTYKIQK